jgi:hypothetical protein
VVPRRKAKHLFTLAYARSHSPTVALTALRFCVEYGRMCDNVADPASIRIEDYAEHVGISRAQAFRRQQAYRECFPKQDVVDLWERVIRENLDGSSFKNEPSLSQAVFAGTLSIKLDGS